MTSTNFGKYELNRKLLLVSKKRFHKYFQLSLIKDFLLTFLFYYVLWVYNFYCFKKYYKESQSAVEMSTIFTSKVAFITVVLVNLHYIAFYYFQWPWAEKYKDNNFPWPWNLKDHDFKAQLKDMMQTYIINQVFIFPPVFIAFLYLFPPDVRTETLPSVGKFVFQLHVMIFIEDFFFYWCHRVLHLPYFYKWIHKKHHSQINTFTLSGVYTHWLEFVFGNLVSMLFGMVVFGPTLHVVTLNVYIISRNIGANTGHSGYSFPWMSFSAYPFSTSPVYHNFHHLKNIGNYSDNFILWDSIFKTNIDYMDKVEKAE